ncbi:uncharacterized protein MELLADRAFT_92823 [Melampsora larici-populina 98AG31]|uniref:Uncharacterized protein n=1 Tax=Melampsora larici-populina (strain 98AG31 / pathotype 3-4-7) TaxID=747676 RepID=F4S2X4_MELLP|nr:uncharacterized protein MELLADRAFT_92823 [Melampsora larici-populina 98AG31]EGG01003.1 hypothetical protein MELLADRAFT_92823 [Melampsora larici-populina 98AG31]
MFDQIIDHQLLRIHSSKTLTFNESLQILAIQSGNLGRPMRSYQRISRNPIGGFHNSINLNWLLKAIYVKLHWSNSLDGHDVI